MHVIHIFAKFFLLTWQIKSACLPDWSRFAHWLVRSSLITVLDSFLKRLSIVWAAVCLFGSLRRRLCWLMTGALLKFDWSPAREGKITFLCDMHHDVYMLEGKYWFFYIALNDIIPLIMRSAQKRDWKYESICGCHLNYCSSKTTNKIHNIVNWVLRCTTCFKNPFISFLCFLNFKC